MSQFAILLHACHVQARASVESDVGLLLPPFGMPRRVLECGCCSQAVVLGAHDLKIHANAGHTLYVLVKRLLLEPKSQ